MWKAKESGRLAIRKDASKVKSRLKNALRPSGASSRNDTDSDPQPATSNTQPLTFQLPSSEPQSHSTPSSIQPPSTDFTFSFSAQPTITAATTAPLRPPAALFPLDQGPDPIEVRSPSELDALIAEETVSLTSSIYNYEYENGRRYHSYRAGKYALPNDDLEAERLDIVHHLSLLFLHGELYTSPIRLLSSRGSLRRALDCGTGTGIWAMEFGHEFPHCEVLGTDLSPIQPIHVPPNVRFEVDDLEDEWLWSEPFDYIHVRTLLGSIADWPAFLRNCYDNTTPGGYTELQEIDLIGIYSEDGTYESKATNYHQYSTLLHRSSQLSGRPLNIAPQLPEMMAEAGFVDITVQRYVQPLGHWPRQKKYREIAYWSVETIVTGLEAYGLALFTRVLGIEMQEALELIEKAREDLLNPDIHACCGWWFISGRRPEVNEKVDTEMT